MPLPAGSSTGVALYRKTLFQQPPPVEVSWVMCQPFPPFWAMLGEPLRRRKIYVEAKEDSSPVLLWAGEIMQAQPMKEGRLVTESTCDEWRRCLKQHQRPVLTGNDPAKKDSERDPVAQIPGPGRLCSSARPTPPSKPTRPDRTGGKRPRDKSHQAAGGHFPDSLAS